MFVTEPGHLPVWYDYGVAGEDLPDRIGPIGKSGEVGVQVGEPAVAAHQLELQYQQFAEEAGRDRFVRRGDLILDPPWSPGVPIGLKPVAGRDDPRQVVRGKGIVGRQVRGTHARDSVVVDVRVKVRGNRSLMTPIVRAERNPIQTSVWFNYLPLVESWFGAGLPTPPFRKTEGLKATASVLTRETSGRQLRRGQETRAEQRQLRRGQETRAELRHSL